MDEKLAKRFWPNQDPIGRRMYRPSDSANLTAVTPRTVFYTVVGVIHDIKLASLVEDQGSVGTDFVPSDHQQPPRGLVFAIRSSVDPMSLAAPVRVAIGTLDPELAVDNVQSMADRMDRSLATRRSPMLLATAFGAIALLLSAIGVYGVLAYVVAQRTKEIGIRLALGSSAAAVFQRVLREALVLVGAGFVVGAAGVLALKQSLDSLLFGFSGADPMVLAGVTLMLAIVALAAGALPAQRATRINPVVALAE